jgi:hypothetical protein
MSETSGGSLVLLIQKSLKKVSKEIGQELQRGADILENVL